MLRIEQFQYVTAIFTKDSGVDPDTFFTMSTKGSEVFDSNAHQICRIGQL
jgi:hypothetical protein